MDFKTVEAPKISSDALNIKRKEDVSKMKTSLLACEDDPKSMVGCIQQVTALRIIHQVTRIVQYLDMMDKIEAKLYESIDALLPEQDPQDLSTWQILLNLQERLQSNMAESHKLLQPYLNLESLGVADLIVDPEVIVEEDDQLIPKSSRDKLRSQAQQVLTLLETGA